MLGDHAIAEGAIAGGCRFFAGYPITPASEVAEQLAKRLPEHGGTYIQMEDELASMAAILGGSWAGKKTMTATSGPGFSLMMENLGLGFMTETPTVVCNVQRGGPSTGLPTMVSQGDMMQAQWGSHGDYAIIAVAPWSVQECFDLTIKAFNLAERYRTPVLVMTDAEVGHLTEQLSIPPMDEIERLDRERPAEPPTDGPYPIAATDDGDLVPPMPTAGEGYRVMVDGLTHDEYGFPDITPETQEVLLNRLLEKIEGDRSELFDVETRHVDDASVVVISYGISARLSIPAIEAARRSGIDVGLYRLRTVWPFPEAEIRELSERVDGIVVPELNMGQIVHEIERVTVDSCPVQLIPHPGGDVHDPADIRDAIETVAAGDVAPSVPGGST